MRKFSNNFVLVFTLGFAMALSGCSFETVEEHWEENAAALNITIQAFNVDEEGNKTPINGPVRIRLNMILPYEPPVPDIFINLNGFAQYTHPFNAVHSVSDIVTAFLGANFTATQEMDKYNRYFPAGHPDLDIRILDEAQAGVLNVSMTFYFNRPADEEAEEIAMYRTLLKGKLVQRALGKGAGLARSLQTFVSDHWNNLKSDEQIAQKSKTKASRAI